MARDAEDKKTKFWLMKSEPDVFSLAALRKMQRSGWDGVRNYQARNYMRDDMQVGDRILFYHSSTAVPGVAGLAKVSRTAHPDPSQFDPDSEYFDPKATHEEPRWWMVEVEFDHEFVAFVSLESMKNDPFLDAMLVLRKGQRLSIQPVEPQHFARVCAMGGAPEAV